MASLEWLEKNRYDETESLNILVCIGQPDQAGQAGPERDWRETVERHVSSM